MMLSIRCDVSDLTKFFKFVNILFLKPFKKITLSSSSYHIGIGKYFFFKVFTLLAIFFI